MFFPFQIQPNRDSLAVVCCVYFRPLSVIVCIWPLFDQESTVIIARVVVETTQVSISR